MTLKDATEEIKLQWRQFLPMITSQAKVNVNGEPSYTCPLCGHGEHGDGLTFIPGSPAGLKCFGCGFSGSDIDLYAQVTNRDANNSDQFIEVVKDMAGMMNISIDEKTTLQDAHTGAKVTAPDKVSAEDVKPLKSQNTASESVKGNTPGLYRQFIDQAASDLFSPAGSAALDYLHNRGLNDTTIKNYKLGYSADKAYFVSAHSTLPAVIFPHKTNYDYYTARSIQGKYFLKPKEAEAGKQPLYNVPALYRDKPCFVCESVLDALSIIQSGGNAAALVGVAWRDVLIPQLREQAPENVLVLCLDNDPVNDEGKSAGQDAQQSLADALTEMNIPFIKAKFTLDKYNGERKDANDLLRDNPDQLREDVERISAEAANKLKPDNTQDYILNLMHGEIEKLIQDAKRKTGFKNLDEKMGSLYSGLYVIGGISSLGKTTFTHQLCDQLAERGEHVIYFSLEQSRLEMVSKSIARQTYLLDKGTTFTSLKIRTGTQDKLIGRAAKQYMNAVGNRVSIVEGNYDCTVRSIGEYVSRYIARNKVKPVVIVDYLQVLTASTDPETGRKPTDTRMIVNDNITALKRISRYFEIPVIAVSSLNRGNYLAPIDFESFKESGSIEFTADVVFGLQLSCMNDEMFTKDKQVVKKRQRIADAKKAIPREVELACLKNRYGDSHFSCFFKYYPQYDCFLESDYKPDVFPDGWEPAEQEELPFNDIDLI